jgi:hypothetical protein
MAKKQSTNQRTQVKDLPEKEKKLSTKDLKKVKGGSYEMSKSDGVKVLDSGGSGSFDQVKAKK